MNSWSSRSVWILLGLGLGSFRKAVFSWRRSSRSVLAMGSNNWRTCCHWMVWVVG